MKMLRKLALLGGAYAGWKYLFDPQEGEGRRARLQEQLSGLAGGAAGQRAKYAARETYGSVRSAASAIAPDRTSASDETLKEKIESEVLRRDEWPKGQLNVDVVDGLVTLRGELDNEDLRTELEQQVRKVSGVIEVENLVHLPSKPAPNKAAALKTSRKAETEGTT